VFDAAAAPQLAEWLNQASLAAHRAVEIICLVGPDHSTGKPSVTIRAIGYASSIADARAKLGPLLAPPAVAALLAPAEVGTVVFTDLTKLSSMPSGKRVAADQIWSDAPLGDLLGAIAHLASGPQATSAISLTGLGGGARTPFMANGDFALSIGGTRSAGIYALWDGADQDQLHLEWVAAAGAALAPFKNGRYVAEADLFNQPPRIEECFSADAWKRLTELKDHYDPKGRFFAV
jgi:FAD/FMN-containing dehydrogenase